jgi:hypothetical protein
MIHLCPALMFSLVPDKPASSVSSSVRCWGDSAAGLEAAPAPPPPPGPPDGWFTNALWCTATCAAIWTSVMPACAVCLHQR